MQIIVENTPVCHYTMRGLPFMVKREDLSCNPPGPPFSKMRGLYDHMVKLKKQGVRHVAYVETAISMAGWGVAVVGEALHMKVTIFEPQYKNPPEVFLFHKSKWEEHGAEILPIRGNVMAKVAWNMAKSQLAQIYPECVLFPLGISFPESITATALELARTWKTLETRPQGIVLAVGSGTIAAGLLMGLRLLSNSVRPLPSVHGVMTRSGNEAAKKKKIYNLSGSEPSGFWKTADFHLYNAGHNYSEGVKVDAPFPINRWYDAKALQWMLDNYSSLPQPLLFWNIGSEVHDEQANQEGRGGSKK